MIKDCSRSLDSRSKDVYMIQASYTMGDLALGSVCPDFGGGESYEAYLNHLSTTISKHKCSCLPGMKVNYCLSWALLSGSSASETLNIKTSPVFAIIQTVDNRMPPEFEDLL